MKLYLESPNSRSACITGISTARRAKVFARIGIKVLRFAGGALDQAVDHLRGAFAEDAVLTVLADGAHHVVAFISLLY